MCFSQEPLFINFALLKASALTSPVSSNRSDIQCKTDHHCSKPFFSEQSLNHLNFPKVIIFFLKKISFFPWLEKKSEKPNEDFFLSRLIFFGWETKKVEFELLTKQNEMKRKPFFCFNHFFLKHLF